MHKLNCLLRNKNLKLLKMFVEMMNYLPQTIINHGRKQPKKDRLWAAFQQTTSSWNRQNHRHKRRFRELSYPKNGKGKSSSYRNEITHCFRWFPKLEPLPQEITIRRPPGNEPALRWTWNTCLTSHLHHQKIYIQHLSPCKAHPQSEGIFT